MYVVIALRPNCLFSHSKYLDSSLLVFSLWFVLKLAPKKAELLVASCYLSNFSFKFRKLDIPRITHVTEI